MKKSILILILGLFLTYSCQGFNPKPISDVDLMNQAEQSAADSKVTALTDLATPVSTDILYIVDDPAGSPLSKKVTVDNLLNTISDSNVPDDITLTKANNNETAIASNLAAINLKLGAVSTVADNAIVRGSGGVRGAQDSGVLIDDTDNITGVADLTASGAVTASSFSTGTSTTPTLKLEDSDAANGTAEISGESTGAYDIIMSLYVDVAGTKTEFMQIDGVAETIDMLKPTTLQVGDIVTAEIADDAVTMDKIDDDGAFTALTGAWATTGLLSGGVVTKSTAANYTVGTTNAAEAYGGVIYVTGACTITLPAVSAGMSVTVITIGAIAVSVDPNASDKIILDGVITLDDGDKATNTSTTGDMIVLTYYDATGWYATSSSWTDGGA